MKWPIPRFFDKSCADGISNHIVPSRLVIFVPAQLRVTKITLPDWVLFEAWPVAGSEVLPKANPLLERFGWKNAGSTKKMNMIWHDHIATHEPRFGILPCINNDSAAVGRSENVFPVVAANCEKNNYGLIVAFDHRHVRWMFTLMFTFPIHSEIYAVASNSSDADSAAPSIAFVRFHSYRGIMPAGFIGYFC